MQTKLLPAASSDRQRLENLLEKYNYEFSQYDKTHFDADGLFGYEWLPTYFEGRDDCAAYLIYAEESLAGFALINRIAECDRPLDWAVAEFFVAYPFRRNGVGSAAMEQVFARHSGRWQIKYHSRNLPSAAFWNGIARHYAAGSVETLCGAEDYADGTPATVLCFSVPAKAQSSRIRLLDTSACWGAAYADGAFSLPRWRGYLDSCLPGAAALCLADAQQSQAAGIRCRAERSTRPSGRRTGRPLLSPRDRASRRTHPPGLRKIPGCGGGSDARPRQRRRLGDNAERKAHGAAGH